MALKFDPITGGLLEPLLNSEKLKYISSTGKIYDSNPRDTLIFSRTKDVSIEKYNKYIKNAIHDPCNNRIKKKCKECNKISLVVVLRFENKIINVCESCKGIYTN